jgi:DDE_Tnp_1-associated
MEARLAGNIHSFLAAVPDPRSRNGRQHPLSAILALVCRAIMCGAKSYSAMTATTALNEYLDWPGVAQVGQIESVVEQGGKVSHETRYFITKRCPRSRQR